MLVKDVMTTNVITIPSSLSIAEAKRMMSSNGVDRLPVVDQGKLVGIISSHRLESISPSKATSLSVWEISYLLYKTKVKEVMEKNVITVTPETTVEDAVSLGQASNVGSVVVVDNEFVVGILTTYDLFYKIVNPVLGIGVKGTRVEVKAGGDPKSLEKILHIVNEKNMDIFNLHIYDITGQSRRDVVLHLVSDDVSQFIDEITRLGFSVTIRK